MKSFYSQTALICLILLGGSWALNGQDRLSLSQAIELGLANNYSIKIEEKNLEIAQNSDDWAIAGRYPTVNLNLNNNNGYANINNPVSFLPTINSFSTGLTPSIDASLTLFDGYRVRLTKEQLEQSVQLAEGNVALAVEGTVENIILAYYQALLQQEQLEVVREVLALSKDRIAYEEARREFGQSGTFDLLQTQDAYLNDSTNYLLQETALQNALRNLNLAMGIDEFNKRYILTDSLTTPIEDYQYGIMQERMLANNRSLQNAFVGRELAGINTRIQEATKYPRISVGAAGTYNYNLSNGEGTTANGETRQFDAIAAKTFNLGVNFTATYRLFDGGVRRKSIENARMQELTQQYTIDDLKRTLNLQLQNTYATYQNQKEVVKVTEELLRNARRNLEITEERFRGGLINSFDYRAVQLGFINASQTRLAAIFNLKATETELVRLMGGLVR